MALPLGKLALIVGAGFVGSVLAKEGRLSNVSDFFSGTYKIVKLLKPDGSTTSSPKPRNDSLMQQVNSLREELQLLASNRSVTIVTGNQSASGKYGIVVIVVVVGYGCIWWKGWKVSDMMFATRRGLNDACASVANQLENVYSSLSASHQKHLSSRIDRVDCKLDECADNTVATKEEVSELRGDVKLIGSDVHSVHHVVRSLETKISRIEGRQNDLNLGVGKLLLFAKNVEGSRIVDQIEGAAASSSSRPALELQKVSPSRAVSLPANTSFEPPSPPTSDGSRKKQAVFQPSNSLQSEVSASGLKSLYAITDDVGGSSLSSPQGSSGLGSPQASPDHSSCQGSSGLGSPQASPDHSSRQGSNGAHVSVETNMGGSSAGLFGRFLWRSRSAVQSSK